MKQTLQKKDGIHIAELGGQNALYELLIPFVNLSIPNKNKPILGETVLIGACLEVLQLSDDEPSYYIYSHLDQAKLSASKVIVFVSDKKELIHFTDFVESCIRSK